VLVAGLRIQTLLHTPSWLQLHCFLHDVKPLDVLIKFQGGFAGFNLPTMVENLVFLLLRELLDGEGILMRQMGFKL